MMISSIIIIIMLCPAAACDVATDDSSSSALTMIKYKLGAMASILVAGAIGVSLPLFLMKPSKTTPSGAVSPDDVDSGAEGAATRGRILMLVVKAFAGGVILATGLVHILPDAFQKLGSDCLREGPWGKFPFAGFVAMMFAIVTLTMESLALGFYTRQHRDHLMMTSHGRDHGVEMKEYQYQDRDREAGDHDQDEMIRRQIVSQILEVGVAVHSTIIGISLGTCKATQTIKPLMAALSFHQLFEGLGLGGSITQAKMKMRSRVLMAVFFSFTAPIGIGIGMAISNQYKENRSASLIVEGMFTSASAGILIYMALVDLLATDFMSPTMLSDLRVQAGCYASLILGAACMSLLAIFA